MKIESLSIGMAIILLAACNSPKNSSIEVDTTSTTANLPAPFATQPAVKFSKGVDWPADKAPNAPSGFTVNRFATDLESARWIYQAPNGDIFVSQASSGKSSPNKITLLRDKDNDGIAEEKIVFLENLNKPLGMLVLNNSFYVANTDGLLRYSYKPGDNKLNGAGNKLLELPAGGYNNHWTRNIIANADGSKIYISVGSGSN